MRVSPIPDILLSSDRHDAILLIWDDQYQHKVLTWLCNARQNPLLSTVRHRGTTFALLSFHPLKPKKAPVDVLVFDMSSVVMAATDWEEDGASLLTHIIRERAQLFGGGGPLIVSLYDPSQQQVDGNVCMVVPQEMYIMSYPPALRILSANDNDIYTLLRETRPDSQANLVLAADFDLDADMVAPSPIGGGEWIFE